ncbi:MAG: hypothetical protein ACRCZF_26685, partial [Gemmataceae bacterium]
EGDLRGRASRMDDIPDMESLRQTLRSLAERKLIVYLSPPERRGTLLTHGFHSPEELRLAANLSSNEASSISTQSPRIEPGRLDQLEASIHELREQVRVLQAEMQKLKDQLGA